MKTPKKSQRKGLTSLEHEEHVVSIIAGLLQHLTGPNRTRLLVKFDENDFEKVERLAELHFRYLSKVNAVDKALRDEMNETEEKLDEDEIYIRRLDKGLFTLQLIDYIILEISVANPVIKAKISKIIQLRRASMDTIKEIVLEYAKNIGDDNKDWKEKQEANIATLLEQF